MAKLHSRDIIKKAKIEMMEEFITKINQYGVNKFIRNGIPNPDVIYQIKKYDETLRFETVEKYLNTIDDLMENKKWIKKKCKTK